MGGCKWSLGGRGGKWSFWVVLRWLIGKWLGGWVVGDGGVCGR